MPTIVSSKGQSNIEAIKRYFCSEYACQMVAQAAGVDYERMIAGDYKLLIEPIAYFTHNGQYDTMAGDAGDRLSGGERQRITIARAMLKQASVIILDEATAYADPENEALIQQAISKLVAGKSLIVVAHRLNTIRNADQILVVANGEIVGRGIQEELLENCPLYRKMWQDYAGSTEGGVEDV